MTMDAQAEIAKLQEQLALCQRELAQSRRDQEEAAATTASNSQTAQRLRQLSTQLDKRLTAGEAVGGSRGWLKRRLFSTMPRADEEADLAVLRASKLMNGPWYLVRYPEIVSTGLSPALHYLRIGAAEQKKPGPAFSTRKYFLEHPELPDGMNPVVHFHASHPGTTS